MYSMWEVHQLVSERHTGLEREARQYSLRRLLKEAPKRASADRTAGSRWGRLTTLLGHRPVRAPEPARR